MNNGPTFVKLLGPFVSTSIAISIALGTGFGLVGVVTGVALGALVGSLLLAYLSGKIGIREAPSSSLGAF